MKGRHFWARQRARTAFPREAALVGAAYRHSTLWRLIAGITEAEDKTTNDNLLEHAARAEEKEGR